MAGINGVGVAVGTVGALLVYSAVSDQQPLDALRSLSRGERPRVPDRPGNRKIEWGAGVGGRAGTGSAGAGTPLVDAVRRFKADQYSQNQRWKKGFSDCSSIVGKGFRVIGVKPPGNSTTWDYLRWGKLKKVSRDQVRAGDLLVNTAHMAVATGPNTAIGQQNPRRDVQEGSIDDIMAGTGAFVCLRYVGSTGGAGSVAA